MTRDVPGIDDAYLAMDTEEGVEVVWNEVIYSQSSRKANRGSKDRLKTILQGLTSVKVKREREGGRRRKTLYNVKVLVYMYCIYEDGRENGIVEFLLIMGEFFSFVSIKILSISMTFGTTKSIQKIA